MIRLLTLTAALAIAALPSPGRAQAYISGDRLLRACNGHSPADENSCDGYIAGALDAVRDSPEYKGKVCPPSNTRLSVMRVALARFGQQRPDEARGPGVALVISFIKTTYPCPVN